MTTKTLQASGLPTLLDAIRQAARLVAPARDGERIAFRPVASPGEIASTACCSVAHGLPEEPSQPSLPSAAT